MGNAVKYSSKVKSPVVFVSGEAVNNYILYQVSDNGIGIAVRDHEKIFELFSRSQPGADFEGSGVA